MIAKDQAKQIVKTALAEQDPKVRLSLLRSEVTANPLLRKRILDLLAPAHPVLTALLREKHMAGSAKVNAAVFQQVTRRATPKDMVKKELRTVEAKCQEIRQRTQDKVDEVDSAIFETADEISQHIKERMRAYE